MSLVSAQILSVHRCQRCTCRHAIAYCEFYTRYCAPTHEEYNQGQHMPAAYPAEAQRHRHHGLVQVRHVFNPPVCTSTATALRCASLIIAAMSKEAGTGMTLPVVHAVVAIQDRVYQILSITLAAQSLCSALPSNALGAADILIASWTGMPGEFLQP